MSDPHPAEEQGGTPGEQYRPDRAGQGSEPDWIEVIDGLIGWAIVRADAAVDDICAYLAERPAIRPWQGAYPGDAFPYRGRGQDKACSALLRRLRSQHGWARRPTGTARPPRLRRLS